MNDVRNYQILKISGNKNFKRIINEIKKIDYITSASIENNKYVLHLEYSTDVIKNEEDIKKTWRRRNKSNSGIWEKSANNKSWNNWKIS